MASDIDLLVLLSTPFDYFAELRQIVDLLYPIQLESEQLISANRPWQATTKWGASLFIVTHGAKEWLCNGRA